MDLGGLLAGKTDALPERDWYSYHGQGGPANETIAVKTADWKLQVVGPDVRKGITPRHEVRLFRMPGDLLERHDLARKHPEVVATLLKKLKVHRALQPRDAIQPYSEGKAGFVAPKEWRIPPVGP